MLDRSPADELLSRINIAVAVANDAERKVTKARDEYVSRSRTVGVLLLEAKAIYPKVKDFEAFLKRVDGLQRSRAYDLMGLAGGRTTDEELRQDVRDRVKKHRAKKGRPERDSVTGPDVTERGETEAEELLPEEPPLPILLGPLAPAWRNVKAAADAGNKARLKEALKHLHSEVVRALKWEILK
jgi:hypothetical protein